MARLWHVTAKKSPRTSKRGTSGSSVASTPRPTSSRVATADGRSPDLRVVTFRRLPGKRPSGLLPEDSPLTVAGAAAALGTGSPALRSLLIPKGHRHGDRK